MKIEIHKGEEIGTFVKELERYITKNLKRNCATLKKLTFTLPISDHPNSENAQTKLVFKGGQLLDSNLIERETAYQITLNNWKSFLDSEYKKRKYLTQKNDIKNIKQQEQFIALLCSLEVARKNDEHEIQYFKKRNRSTYPYGLECIFVFENGKYVFNNSGFTLHLGK